MFKISGEKEVKLTKSVKLAPSLIKKIEKESKKNKVSFSKFVSEACKYALDNMNKKS